LQHAFRRWIAVQVSFVSLWEIAIPFVHLPSSNYRRWVHNFYLSCSNAILTVVCAGHFSRSLILLAYLAAAVSLTRVLLLALSMMLPLDYSQVIITSQTN
jgi:hypothetical protein